jgi:hypothetical protein
MEILHIEKNGQLVNTLELILIYNLSTQRQQMNVIFTDTNNPIFDLILGTYSPEKYPHQNPITTPSRPNFKNVPH